MKFILTLLLIAAALLAPVVPAFADVAVEAMLSAGTVTNETTRTTGFTAVEIPKVNNVGLALRFTGAGAATDNLTLTFARSVDGSNYETTPRFTWRVALNGTTAVVGYTNLVESTIGAARYLKLVSIQNEGTNNATNVYVEVIKKTIKASP